MVASPAFSSHSEARAVLVVEPALAPRDAVAALDDAELGRLLARGGVRSVYQPIVELDSNVTVAYEALARGPQGSPLAGPDRLFAAAGRAGRLVELDRACQFAAAAGARSAGLSSPWTLFVNVEPQSAAATIVAPVRGPDGSPGPGAMDCQIVVEFTERALTTDPTTLLGMVARIRDRGWGIALDDVGAHPDSLALLPLLQPDVIKLDLSLVQQQPSAQIAAIVNAVNAEAERSGSAVLAEGIETEEHRSIALAMGATLGQGWLLGRPAALPDPLPDFTGTPVAVDSGGGVAPSRTPFVLGAARRPVRLSRKELLIEMSKHLEAQAVHAGESTVVLATFQHAEFFTPRTRERYQHLARRTAFVGALGAGMPAVPALGVRGGVLDLGDPLIGEWDLAVVGPHFAATLVARDLGDSGPDRLRRFEFVLSHDRDLAIQVALALMTRVCPQS